MGINFTADVIIAQHLLNLWMEQHLRKKPFDEKGIPNAVLGDVIALFQRKVLGTRTPDGRMDPGAQTIRKLITSVRLTAGLAAQPVAGNRSLPGAPPSL